MTGEKGDLKNEKKEWELLRVWSPRNQYCLGEENRAEVRKSEKSQR